jgi:hypothetical protein
MPNARAGSSIVRHKEAEGAATLNSNTMRKNSCLKLAKWKTILYLSFSEPQQVWNKADKTELYWQAHSRSTPGKSGKRAWKALPWSVMDQLHDKGYISDPATKAKSVWLSDEGARLSEELFEKLFAVK